MSRTVTSASRTDPAADDGATGVPLRSLRAIAAVAANGGVAAAGEALHQSAAAVSRAVASAEQTLGLALFERGARGMLPTQAGALLARRAQRALQALQAGAAGLRLRGAPASVAALPRLISDPLMQALVARDAHPSEAAAAAALGLSQPALNQALRRLEHAARVPLYERTRQGARLNDAGEWLLQHVKRAQAEIRIGRQELDRHRGRGAWEVAIGALPMATDVLVPQAVAQSLAASAHLRVAVKDGTYEALTRLLRSADIDLIVGPLRGDGELAPDLVEQVLYVDRFVAVVRSDHPALRAGRRVTLRQLAPYPWIGPLPGTPSHAIFDRLFAQAGLGQPNVTLRAYSAGVVRSVLLAGDHVALLSPLHVHAEVQAGLLAHASRPLPGSERRIGITQRRDALASAACEDVIAALHRVAAEAAAGLPR